jgi:dienelactone hydrolase
MGAKEVSIKYKYTDTDNNEKETMMPGYLFHPENGSGPFPTIIFNNGSDGPTSAMWSCGVYGALKRGYAALVFDGPGQNSMFWEQNIPFRYDWENVITPVVDFLKTHSDVDPDKIVLSGISQGGYWALRALAYEHRIAAGIADPGVMDVSKTWLKDLPPEMLKLLHGKFDAEKEKEFNDAIQGWLNTDPKFKQNMLWRMKPYQTTSFYEAYKMVQKYKVNVRDIQNIKCPIWIADPEGEQFWPGQSQLVYDALTPKQKGESKIVKFTKAEGADGHCEPMARSLYDQRMFDWLDEVEIK